MHLVGGSASECDTIPGRQSMASAFFLYGQFEEVLVYLNSIRSYFINDDTFNYNYAQVRITHIIRTIILYRQFEFYNFRQKLQQGILKKPKIYWCKYMIWILDVSQHMKWF